MSYKSRKKKKSFLSQMKYRFGLAKIALYKKFKKKERGNDMRLRQTNEVMNFLRNQARIIRPNNLRINEWVDDYVNRCVLNGSPVEILTQVCISKSLEMRYKKQGDVFIPTKKERLLFLEDIPRVKRIFQENGIACNWWMTFNPSYLDSGRTTSEICNAYVEMLRQLGEPLIREGWFMLTDWEADILGSRPAPNPEVLADINRFVKPEALQLEIQRQSTWMKEQIGLEQADEAVRRDVYLQIACEAEEGRYLMNDAPFGEYILMPLETAERYDFFTILAPGFKDRIVAILPAHPWRLGE